MQNNERREHILEKIFQECVYYCIGNCSYANNKRSAGIALQRNGIMPQKRPAAGGESCEHDSFYSFLIESAELEY